MKQEISEFILKPPTCRFMTSLDGSEPESVFAYRWPRDQFDSLKNFVEFTCKFASVMQFHVGEYLPKDFEYYYTSDPGCQTTVEFLLRDTPRTNAQPLDLVTEYFPGIEIPWLEKMAGTKTMLVKYEPNPEILSMDSQGFVYVFVAENVDYVETAPKSSNPTFQQPISNSSSEDAVPYEADSEKWDAATDAIQQRIEKHLGTETPIVFSAYDEDTSGIPIDPLDTIAVLDYVVFVAEADSFWGGENSQSFRSQLLDEPTWMALCAVLHDQLQSTKDFHHVFLEGIEQTGWTNQDGKPAAEYQFILGS